MLLQLYASLDCLFLYSSSFPSAMLFMSSRIRFSFHLSSALTAAAVDSPAAAEYSFDHLSLQSSGCDVCECCLWNTKIEERKITFLLMQQWASEREREKNAPPSINWWIDCNNRLDWSLDWLARKHKLNHKATSVHQNVSLFSLFLPFCSSITSDSMFLSLLSFIIFLPFAQTNWIGRVKRSHLHWKDVIQNITWLKRRSEKEKISSAIECTWKGKFIKKSQLISTSFNLFKLVEYLKV